MASFIGENGGLVPAPGVTVNCDVPWLVYSEAVVSRAGEEGWKTGLGCMYAASDAPTGILRTRNDSGVDDCPLLLLAGLIEGVSRGLAELVTFCRAFTGATGQGLASGCSPFLF